MLVSRTFTVTGLPTARTIALAGMLTCLAVRGPLVAQDIDVNVNINTGVQIETRGPVHEAFAEPVVFGAEPALAVAQPPPQPIDELPPEELPEGEDMTWIPGYWGWDEERETHLWISGVWRNVPPGRQYVPGYWAPEMQGQQWVSGFWLPEDEQTIQYLPEPPAPQELMQIGEPPSAQHVWVPGVWMWREARFVWRPGYWLQPPPQWVWVPSHWVWTPSGHVFVSGYWDYALPQRGMLFAPAYIRPAVYTRPRFVYTPSVVLNVDLLVDHLFVRPRYRHYYFGDFYAQRYERVGILPVFRFHRHIGFSSIFAHQAAVHRVRMSDWENRYQRAYLHRREHAFARPPRTYAAYQRVLRQPDVLQRLDRDDRRSLMVARSLDQYRSGEEGTRRLQRLSDDGRSSLLSRLPQFREYQQRRRQIETSGLDRDALRERVNGAPVLSGGTGERDVRPRPAEPGAGREVVRGADRQRTAERDGGPTRQVSPRQLTLPRSPVSATRTRDTDRSRVRSRTPGVPESEARTSSGRRVETRGRSQTDR
jgi:hypothetical protein